LRERACQIRRSKNTASPASAITSMAPSGSGHWMSRRGGPSIQFVLRGADHQHFADDVEGSHEALRAMTLPGEAAWMTAAMLPMSQLWPG
jgi:hypothetical protein